MNRFFYILSITITTFLFAGCDDCKECFFIEESNNIVVEHALGEFCGADLQEKENAELICIEGDCYYECR